MPALRDLLRLPSRIALLLGLGALSAGGTEAVANTEPVDGGAPIPQHSSKTFGELLIWQAGGRIYVSEGGRLAEELRLGDSAEAQRLLELLNRIGATATAPHAMSDRIILVGDGGSGLHWDAQKVEPGKERAVSGPGGANKPVPTTQKPTAGTVDTRPPSTDQGNKK